jgi:ubiquinone/menaquinone biosynthesis C-methylase UbiE
VNAIHHFERLDLFIAEARRLLRPGGTLAVIGMDPHHGRDHWCVYDYFPEAKVTDLARYPSSGKSLTRCFVSVSIELIAASLAVSHDATWWRCVRRSGAAKARLLADDLADR